MKRILGIHDGFTVIDALITLCLIGVLFGVVVPRYQRVAHEAQVSALKSELANLRTSISLFRLVNGRNPKGLQEMLEKDTMLPGRVGADPYTGSVFKEKYLRHQKVDAEGRILDAFGNPFAYDSVRGEARTTTPGYERW